MTINDSTTRMGECLKRCANYTRPEELINCMDTCVKIPIERERRLYISDWMIFAVIIIVIVLVANK